MNQSAMKQLPHGEANGIVAHCEMPSFFGDKIMTPLH